MKRTAAIWPVVITGVAMLVAPVFAKKLDKNPTPYESPAAWDAALPSNLARQYATPLRAAAVADTFLLHHATFDDANGQANLMGYTSVDRTDQDAVFWHVADGTELDGGSFGKLLPLAGGRSMWCGQDESSDPLFCRYATLPGYGDRWDQILVSEPLVGDSIHITYKVFWDSEAAYDGTRFEYTMDDGASWVILPITDTFSARSHTYDNTGPTPFLVESVGLSLPGVTNAQVRFRFQSDGAWSDEDGLRPSDGAIIVDDITVETWTDGVAGFSNTEDFESANVGTHAAGIWTGERPEAFGDFAALYPGVLLLQEDPCDLEDSFVWGFFDDPAHSNYGCRWPDPRPDVGTVPYVKHRFGDWPVSLYINNEIWSPPFADVGSGDQYRLRFHVYRDLELESFVFYIWHVRSWKNGCPGPWRDDNFVHYGAQRDWLDATFDLTPYVDPDADALQIAIGVRDMCGYWCAGYYGNPECHSHAPLIDDIRVERINSTAPQFSVRHQDLFQDSFAEIVAQPKTGAGKAAADAANDILPSASPAIMPGDSVVMTITGVGSDGGAPAAYAYVRVQNSNAPKSGAALGSADTRPGLAGVRWPYVGDETIDGQTWSVFRMDHAIAYYGPVANRYCVDLNDDLFAPGDTIWYFFGADADGTPYSGDESYWHRTLDGQGQSHTTMDIAEAATSPCEFTILPAGGVNRGGDILYVDDTDDRGGPAELFFDSAFDMLGIRDRRDRYDVLAPSSIVANSLASRVKDNASQIIANYKTIIWQSSDLHSGTVGDGTGHPEKSDDWGLLYQFLETSDRAPGLYLSGSDLAEEWVHLGGPGAVQTRASYMSFNLSASDHIQYGEAVSPTLTASGPAFIHSGVPDVFVAYGGCPGINDFDVLQPMGTAGIEFPYPTSGDGAVISQQTTNSLGETATVVLSGFGYERIRDLVSGGPPARAEHLRDILIMMGGSLDEATGVDPDETPVHANALFANYPNPFNPTTTIRYSIQASTHVSLRVYNPAGQLVRTLVDATRSPGAVQPVVWDGMNDAGQAVASGVYFYKLVTKGFAKTRKMVLLK